MWFLALCIFARLFWRYRETLVKHPLALCAGNAPVTGEFPSQWSVTRSFDVSFICAWINGWVNNRAAGDLRRHRSHYDITVICFASDVLLWPAQRNPGLWVGVWGRGSVVYWIHSVRPSVFRPSIRPWLKSVSGRSINFSSSDLQGPMC